ncbi:MAG: universal stress protein [Halobacteriales archaeon]
MSLGSDSTILISVDVSTDSQPIQSLVDLFQSVDVILIGYYPSQGEVAPARVRQERKSEATSTLEEIADVFRTSGVNVTETLVFAYYRQDSIDYAAKKYGCDAVLTLGEAESIERILTPIRGDTNLERIVGLLESIMRESDTSVTFFHSVMEDTNPSHGEFLVRGAADRLTQAGIDRDRVDWRLSNDESPEGEIIQLGEEHDLLVLGETKPSLRHRILGSVPTRIVDEVDTPAFVVRDTNAG